MQTPRATVATGVLPRGAEQLASGIGWTLAVFTLINVIGETAHRNFDVNFLWMPLEPHGWGARLTLAVFAVLLLWGLLRPAQDIARYALTQALLLFLVFQCLLQIGHYYRDLARGVIESKLPVPFAALAMAGLLTQVWRVWRTSFREEPPQGPRRRRIATIMAGALIAWECFLVGQFFLFGSVTYRRPADCIIVMGAGVTEYGRPSLSLYDRTYAGVRLYAQGMAPCIIVTGGPGPEGSGTTEPQVMSRLCRQLGVNNDALVLDEGGHTTFLTVENCRPIMRKHGWRTALIVSHDFHLSRTLMAFHRGGVRVWTAPAIRTRVIGKDYFNIVRESAAWTFYWLRPFWQSYVPA